MSRLKYLIIHCTATPANVWVDKADIERWHLKERGWSRLGYSDLIRLDGTLINLTPFDQDNEVDYNEMTWGVRGINALSRHIVYAGGLDENHEPKDTRTPHQLKAMETYVRYTKLRHPDVIIKGHNDFANKACPCFNVTEWLKQINL